jgi:hypothetical protein
MSAAEAKLSVFSPEERARRLELLDAFTQLVAEKPLADLQRARDDLAHAPADPAASATEAEEHERAHQALVQARARNLARVLEDRARLTAECLPASLVQKGLGVSRQRLHQLVKAGRLVAVLTKDRRSSLYPAWQFAADGTPLPGLAAVIAAAHAVEMDPETLHFFMVEPDERLGGGTPADLLATGEGDRVATLLRSAGLGPFSG